MVVYCSVVDFKVKIFISLFLFILMMILSCDIEGMGANPAKEIEIAETIIYGLNQKKIQKGRLLYEIKADKAETFSKENKTRIFEMDFTQYDKEGVVVAKGQAVKVEYNVETENALIDGALSFNSITEGVTLFSTWLKWDNEKKIITGKEDIPVRLEKESGTVLEGMGFKAVTETKTVSFSNGMKGIFVPEKKSKSKGERGE